MNSLNWNKIVKLSKVKTIYVSQPIKIWADNLEAPEPPKYQTKTQQVNLNTEQIWRRSISETFIEYLENCSLSGVRYLVDSRKSRLEKWVWFFIILSAVLSLVYVIVLLQQESSSKPVLVSLESTRHHIRNVAFPAVAICNVNRISKTRAKEYADLLYSQDNSTYSLEELSRLALMLGRLHDYELDGYDKLLSFESFLLKVEQPFDVDARLRQLSPSCKDAFVRCKFREGIRDCDELFPTRRTQNGYCCAFNYHHEVAETLGVKETSHEDKMRTVPLPGYAYGLSLVLDPHLEDYGYTLHNSLGFDVLIFDPYDYPDQTGGGLVHRILAPDVETFLNLRASTVYSTKDVRTYSIQERDCRFSNEMLGKFKGHYTYSNCIVQCRIRALVRLCGCFPFFLPSSDQAPICTLENIPCLNKYKQKMMFLFPPVEIAGLEVEREDSLLCPECYPDCVRTRFSTTAILTELAVGADWMSGINLTGKSVVHIYYGDVDTDLYKMDVLFYWFEIISNLGGLCGLFIGFSLMTVAEFIYFLTVRFTHILSMNTRKYRPKDST